MRQSGPPFLLAHLANFSTLRDISRTSQGSTPTITSRAR